MVDTHSDAFVVDTSVFARWFLDQVGAEHAREVRAGFFAGDVRLETVDCVRFELGHVLRTRGLLKGRLSADEYLAAVRSIDDLGITIHPTDADVLERAGALAVRCMLRFFDAVLVEHALRAGLPLLSSDRKLAGAVDGVVRVQILRGVP